MILMACALTLVAMAGAEEQGAGQPQVTGFQGPMPVERNHIPNKLTREEQEAREAELRELVAEINERKAAVLKQVKRENVEESLTHLFRQNSFDDAFAPNPIFNSSRRGLIAVQINAFYDPRFARLMNVARFGTTRKKKKLVQACLNQLDEYLHPNGDGLTEANSSPLNHVVVLLTACHIFKEADTDGRSLPALFDWYETQTRRGQALSESNPEFVVVNPTLLAISFAHTEIWTPSTLQQCVAQTIYAILHRLRPELAEMFPARLWDGDQPEQFYPLRGFGESTERLDGVYLLDGLSTDAAHDIVEEAKAIVGDT